MQTHKSLCICKKKALFELYAGARSNIIIPLHMSSGCAEWGDSSATMKQSSTRLCYSASAWKKYICTRHYFLGFNFMIWLDKYGVIVRENNLFKPRWFFHGNLKSERLSWFVAQIMRQLSPSTSVRFSLDFENFSLDTVILNWKFMLSYKTCRINR